MDRIALVGRGEFLARGVPNVVGLALKANFQGSAVEMASRVA